MLVQFEEALTALKKGRPVAIPEAYVQVKKKRVGVYQVDVVGKPPVLLKYGGVVELFERLEKQILLRGSNKK